LQGMHDERAWWPADVTHTGCWGKVASANVRATQEPFPAAARTSGRSALQSRSGGWQVDHRPGRRGMPPWRTQTPIVPGGSQGALRCTTKIFFTSTTALFLWPRRSSPPSRARVHSRRHAGSEVAHRRSCRFADGAVPATLSPNPFQQRTRP
jgi:hypothetical protein